MLPRSQMKKLTSTDWGRIFRKMSRKLWEFRDRIIIVPQDSARAAHLLSSFEVDFVYIDDDHTFEGCERSIEAWAPIIKEDGWMGGHDYHRHYHGVCNAVCDAFGEDFELDIESTWFHQFGDVDDDVVQ